MALAHHNLDDRVSDLIDEASGCWMEVAVRHFFRAKDAEVILHIPLSRSCTIDRLIWPSTNTGKFSVKLAYRYAWQLIFGSEHHDHDQVLLPVWNAIWFLNVPPKIKHVLWRLIWEILPSRDILLSRGIDVELGCGACSTAEESYFHLFFDCEWSKRVWKGVLLVGSLHSIQPNSFLDDFLDFFLAVSATNREIVAVTLWYIWNNRNKCIFNHTCLSPERGIRNIRNYLDEFKAATSVDDEQMLEAKTNPVVAETAWTRPPDGVVKINVDASIPHQAGMVSLGVVLRDSNGRVLGAGKKTMSFHGGVTHAEMLAICFGVQLGKKFGCRSIIVESDCLNAVQVAAFSNECYLPYGALVEDLKECIRFFSSCSFKYIRGHLNDFAHRIAKLSPTLSPWEGVWVGTLPSAIYTDPTL
ncbi:hypothetical protein SLA2020_024590 [Shorea laevis]